MFAALKLFEPHQSGRRRSGRSAPRRHVRLGFEPLEARELLSATTASVQSSIDALGHVKVDKAQVSSSTTKGQGFVYYRYGNQADLPTTPSAGLALEGGGTDVDQLYQWMGAKANGGDFLVLGTSGKDAYDSYIYNLNLSNPAGNRLNSVSTLVITSSDATANSFVLEKLVRAEAIFIEGGDQSTYMNLWLGSPVQSAIRTALGNNAPIGGTSAGNAVLGQFIFSARNGTAYSSTVLANPYDTTVTIDQNFLSDPKAGTLPIMANTILDDHFYQRDRMGRLDTFMARLVQDYGTPATGTKGIGIDEQTALLIDTATGVGQVVGNNAGHVYFMETTGSPQICQPDTPLTYTYGKRGVAGVSVQRASIGDAFNLNRWTEAGGIEANDMYTLLAVDGLLSSTQTNGSIY